MGASCSASLDAIFDTAPRVRGEIPTELVGDFPADDEPAATPVGEVNYASDSDVPADGTRRKVVVEDESAEKGVGCVRPWEGAVVAPDDAPAANLAAPDARLELEWAYGFKTQGVRGTLAIDSRGRLIYPTAAVVVAFDAKTNKQEHFCGHNDDIVSFAQHPTRPDVIATGQMATIEGKRSADPFICVYDWSTQQTYKLPAMAKQRKVGALAFSADGRYLASAGFDNDYTITVWDWESKSVVASCGGLNKVECTYLAWSPKAAEFCAVGPKSVAFYTLSGASLTVKSGKFGNYERSVNFLAVAYTDKGTACVAAESGDVYAFVGDRCAKVFNKVMDTAISHLAFYQGGLLLGGAQLVRHVSSTMETVADYACGAGRARCIAVNAATGAFAVGTSLSEIWLQAAPSAQPNLVAQAHSDGELWAVAVTKSGRVVTAGEDNKIMTWDPQAHRIVSCAPISTKTAGLRRRDPRAATTSLQPQERCARAISVSPDGAHLAIGLNSGCVNVYDAHTLELVTSKDLNSFGKPNHAAATAENWIEDLKYSPTGGVLAVGTHGSVIVLLNVANNYAAEGCLKAHNSPIAHLDWSVDGAHLQSSCVGYELLFHDVDATHLKSSKQNTSPSALKNVQWASQSLPFGWTVSGLVTGAVPGHFFNGVARAGAGDLIATGDDSGVVRLYRCPAQGACTQFKAHSSHVVRLAFSEDDASLFTTGGADKTLMQWRVVRA